MHILSSIGRRIIMFSKCNILLDSVELKFKANLHRVREKCYRLGGNSYIGPPRF